MSQTTFTPDPQTLSQLNMIYLVNFQILEVDGFLDLPGVGVMNEQHRRLPSHKVNLNVLVAQGVLGIREERLNLWELV